LILAQAAGECYRLYSEPAYEKRPQVAEAEILRTDLSSAILTLIAMKQNPFEFPYLDQPSRPFSEFPCALENDFYQEPST
jgi:HrpA-like RNA helicase